MAAVVMRFQSTGMESLSLQATGMSLINIVSGVEGGGLLACDSGVCQLRASRLEVLVGM